MPGISVVLVEDAGELLHTYSTYGRDVEGMIGAYNLLALTPMGRNEQDVSHKMAWVRHHDRHAALPLVSSCGTAHAQPPRSVLNH